MQRVFFRVSLASNSCQLVKFVSMILRNGLMRALATATALSAAGYLAAGLEAAPACGGGCSPA